MKLVRNPRVAVVIPTYGRIGGAENVAVQLSERLAASHGFDIHVFAHRRQEPSGNTVFHRIPIWPFPRWMRPVSFAAFASRAIRREAIDLVHSHERIFRMDLLSFHGIPHRMWVRNIRKKSPGLFDLATSGVESCGIRHPGTRKILAISGLVKRYLSDAFPECRNKIQIFHPGVSLDCFPPGQTQSRRENIRNEMGLDRQDTVILFVGMNFEVKRLGLVMRGIADLGEAVLSRHRVQLLVVGKGDTVRYHRLASRLGIGDRVHFAGVRQQLETWYPAGDFLVMPSRMDTFGLVVLEAMAAGLPVVISGRVGAADLVRPGENGLILSEDPSVAEMKNALAAMMDPNLRDRMGAAARLTAQPHDWDAAAERLAVIYREILLEKQSRGSHDKGKRG